MHGFLHGNGSCFMVTWTTFTHHILEKCLIQNWETMALRSLTSVDLVYVLSCVKTPHEYNFIDITFGWGFGHIWLHTTLGAMWPHYMILEVSWDILWTMLLGSHNFMVTALGLCVRWRLRAWSHQWMGRDRLLQWLSHLVHVSFPETLIILPNHNFYRVIPNSWIHAHQPWYISRTLCVL